MFIIMSRPGLKRLDTGALVKDYEGQEKEIEQAVQMALSEVASEDPRYVEKDAPPMHEEFPEGSKVFFLGAPAYGMAAQISATDDTSLSVILVVSTLISHHSGIYLSDIHNIFSSSLMKRRRTRSSSL